MLIRKKGRFSPLVRRCTAAGGDSRIPCLIPPRAHSRPRNLACPQVDERAFSVLCGQQSGVRKPHEESRRNCRLRQPGPQDASADSRSRTARRQAYLPSGRSHGSEIDCLWEAMFRRSWRATAIVPGDRVPGTVYVLCAAVIAHTAPGNSGELTKLFPRDSLTAKSPTRRRLSLHRRAGNGKADPSLKPLFRPQ